MINKYKNIYHRIGNNLKKERKKANLTQEQLANITARVDKSKISNIENAKEDYMLSTLLELTNALGIDIEQLLSIKD
ncbi:helix-turn-helix domain-containing protein [Sphingobacterium mizutaii]|uniref:helix-turn-helix domain-containing protein n=1 Tax=Sphingobacterium mizutaii TaxID=1010 RepID=UPI0028AA54D2|nr:helix-turn-helix transcriptional regulator [Sphingobacterium mizutaii]